MSHQSIEGLFDPCAQYDQVDSRHLLEFWAGSIRRNNRTLGGREGECEEQSCDTYMGNCQNDPIINITRASDETACDPIQDGYSHSDV